MTDFQTRVARARAAVQDRGMLGDSGLVERRSVPFVEVRGSAVDQSEHWTVYGHAAVYHDLSQDLGGFRERIEPGAFAAVLATNPDVRALYNHDPNLVLARTANGTLRLEEDARGLAYEADVAQTSYGADLRVLLERGDVTQSSFAFRLGPGGDSWTQDPDSGGLIRTIHTFAALYDVSPVTYPATTSTDSGARSQPLISRMQLAARMDRWART